MAGNGGEGLEGWIAQTADRTWNHSPGIHRPTSALERAIYFSFAVRELPPAATW